MKGLCLCARCIHSGDLRSI